jgi:hypothetical protein
MARSGKIVVALCMLNLDADEVRSVVAGDFPPVSAQRSRGLALRKFDSEDISFRVIESLKPHSF